MADHILNRPAPPAKPKADPAPKPTPEQAKIDENKRRTKAAEAVARAISGGRR
ncbi:hypothetical protein [Mycobacterium sp. KBS0706]|uniref:hypothetical protein n=1 Tax=Mycobacterium sp. KBS0706 TaxID=2578109 RepID=UPI00163DC320|nr:hypothetical protein [Mycobacterium sp. KBS0706]